jgi:crotonobetainyl-CoA:carnitine CoA-transferase CaiB-like acyl-CoA transferase
LLEEDWGSFALRLVGGELGEDGYDAADSVLRPFFASKTKAELLQAAVERKLLLAPVLELDEVVEGAQLTAREFSVSVERPDGGGTARFPGPFAKFGTSEIRYRQRPPRLDEHGAELRAEEPREPAAIRGGGAAGSPLEGVKILDLFWVLAGPGATRMLADYGASVVHVESTQRLDTLRVIQPFQFSHPHPESAAGFQSANVNKLGITLDLSCPEGRDIALDLVRWADVVTESFAPGVIDRYGLGYETLRELKPDIIMISSCLMGQTGPWRDLTGFGNLAASATAYQQLASWPGRPPSGPYGAYTDFISVRYNAIAILAAVEHRNRTGQGQYIDQAQAEAALHFLAPAYLDYTVNGVVPTAVGNDDAQLFPHGIFPALGENRWLAIAIRDDRDWEALCAVIGREDLIAQRDQRDEVNAAISAWTEKREAADAETLLQARDVPAHVALDTPGLHADPQLQHRDHFIEVAHEIFPTSWVESTRLLLSETPARRPDRALHFGRDNREVLEEILGYAPERIAELAERGVLR